ncbi:FUSC family protein [Undibacterium arcticum]
MYIVKIITGSVMLWFGLHALGVADPYWAMISLIIVTEPDVKIAKANFNARLINTISGSMAAGLALIVFGTGLFFNPNGSDCSDASRHAIGKLSIKLATRSCHRGYCDVCRGFR